MDLNRHDYVVLHKYAFSDTFIMGCRSNIYGCFEYAADNKPKIVLPDRKTPSSNLFIALLKDSVVFEEGKMISTTDLSDCVALDERIMRMIQEDRMNVGLNTTASAASTAQTQ